MANVTVIPATKEVFTSVPIASQQKKRVAAYARVSTDSEEQKTSYDAQIDYYTKFIQSKPDWDFVGVYTDEGITGTSTKRREGFNDMISDALAGKIDLIVTKSVSRFARNTVDTLTAVRQLKDKGVEVWFEKENIRTLDAKGELFITIMSSLAQEESRSISENVTWGKRKQFENGRVSFAYSSFLGYDKGKDKCDPPVVNPEQAEIVKKIYKWFMTGMTPFMIAKRLTESGIKSPMGKDKWVGSSVESILTNEKYMGDAILQKTFTVDFLEHKTKKNTGEVPMYHVKNNHEAIIPPAEWELVQREMARRKALGRHYSGQNMFSGKVICGCCGGFYGPKVWDSTSSKYRRVVWQCNQKYANADKCTTPHITEDRIKTAFVEAFNDLYDMKKELLGNVALIKKHLTNTAGIDKRMEKLAKEMETVSELSKNLINQNAQIKQNQEEYQERYNAYVEQFNKANAEYEELKKQKSEQERKALIIDVFVSEFKKVKCKLTEFDETLWHTMLEHATVSTDGVISFLFANGTIIEKPCK
jgi:DNA invertase Pin-like site-specific DNA recombinase